MLAKRGEQTQHVRLGVGVVTATSRPAPMLEHINALLNINEK
jgi:alkanesulfonate monooxygenase SsuD/methylene tetrahydromethanopterin reductase-like flavin-dependent oxidoreductase (luciferase family)